MDYITKAINAKIKEFETLCLQQKDVVLKSSASILKLKKKVISHDENINKMKPESFKPKSIGEKIKLQPVHMQWNRSLSNKSPIVTKLNK